MGREHANPPVFSPLFHNKPNQNDGFIRGWRWATGLFILQREWEFQPRQTKCQIETEVVPGDTTMPSWLPNALNSDKGMICLRRWTMQRQNVWGGCARSRRHLIVLYLKLDSKLAIRSAQPFFFFNKECLHPHSPINSEEMYFMEVETICLCLCFSVVVQQNERHYEAVGSYCVDPAVNVLGVLACHLDDFI